MSDMHAMSVIYIAEVEVATMDAHHEERSIPLVCPSCTAALTADGSVDEYQYVPSRRRGRFEYDLRTGVARFVEDILQDRWHQTEDLDQCPSVQYACRECDTIVSEPISRTR